MLGLPVGDGVSVDDCELDPEGDGVSVEDCELDPVSDAVWVSVWERVRDGVCVCVCEAVRARAAVARIASRRARLASIAEGRIGRASPGPRDGRGKTRGVKG